MSGHSQLLQSIYAHVDWDVKILVSHENDLTQGAIDWLTSSIESDTIGLYASYGARSALSRLAFATRTRVLVVSFKAGSAKAKRTLASRKRLQDTLLCSSIIKVGFLMDVLAFSLFHDLDVRVENIFNLSESSAEVSMSEFHQALGDERLASKPAVLALFNTIDKRDITANDVALHAWAAVEGGLLPHVQAKRAKRLPMSTDDMNIEQLKVAAKLRRHQALLRTLVPVTVKNDITADFKVTKQGLAVVSGRFKTRIQQSKGGQTIQVAMQQGNRKVTVSGQAKKVDGRSATITSDKSAIGSSPGKILSVTTIGKELPSRSENLRAVLLRQALQDTSSVLSNPFVEAIWLPGRTPQWILDPIPTTGSYGLAPSSAYQLNPSQVQAVNSILSSASKDRTVLIHGPPGTGKTTVIAAAAHNLTLRDRSATIWLVAHSNVAVKNIAEKLAKIDFEGFKLVVSKDFHYDWHEHLYQKIEHKMIRTDSLPETRLEAQRVLLDARVILCTLTTLLNDRLAPITAVVPVETLIMDEASQIEIGDYVPVINRYQHYLRKMVFIGDHKQLAPYGYEDIKELESIFEKKHLRKSALLLDTQYRMPLPIGAFISKNVYEGRLQSQHATSSWKTCRFVDVQGSKEAKRGNSWVNEMEARTAIAIARTLHNKGCSYRIITPYDPQRSFLENGLKIAKLPHEDKCFNVDSFQGNEDDYIIISVVRTDKIGFLREDRRANVMLTRCKKGMVLCTNKHFVEDLAKSTLSGVLVAHEVNMHAQENKLLLSSQPSITFTSRSPKFPLFFPAIQMAENNSRPRSKRSSTGNSATSRRTTISFCQTLTSGPGPKLNNKIEILVAKEDTLRRSDFAIFDHIRPIGISIGYKDGGSGRVLAIALVDDCNGMVFEFSTKKKTGDGRKLLEELVLCRESGVLVAFDMGPLILSLYSEFNLLVCKAVDLQSAFNPDDPGRSEFDTIKAVIGEVAAPDLKRTNIEKVFRSQKYDPETKHSKLDLVARAWAAQFTVDGIEDLGDPEKMRAINLQGWDEEKLKLVAKIATDAIRLDNIKPGETQHQFEGVSRGEDNSLRANAASYNHKFRGQKNVTVALDGPRGVFYAEGIVTGGDGRAGVINTRDGGVLDPSTVASIESGGRETKTFAEARRADAVLRMLQGVNDPFERSPFIKNIWIAPKALEWPPEWTKKDTKPAATQKTDAQDNPQPQYKLPNLNKSQKLAVNTMLSPSDRGRLVIVQGPPGTGKTSVIGTCVAMAMDLPDPQGLWLVAQSNVAVKNIAEKLISIDFDAWKLLVSKDFIYEWHEHLYNQNSLFRGHLIRSDQFKFIKPKELKECKVILCTLSMLSNQSLSKFTKHIPLKFLIVDEASQIEIGNYYHVFDSFSSTLRKVCFIGDDKQLPPHGEEDLESLKSIFEVEHLQEDVIFLDTQYRMPPQIGEIISSAVYDDKLKSNPLHKIPNTSAACYFIDVPLGRETKNPKGSSLNFAEQDTVIEVAKALQALERKYKIITPYAAQTSAIEDKMKECEELTWEDTCFNVDAFQGNEEDYIIISVVRTDGLGFLQSLRRVNVMLTRCKKGMYIVCSRKFLSGPVGGDCLVGEMLDKMVEKYGEKVWITPQDITNGTLAPLL